MEETVNHRENPLKKYLEKSGESIFVFARKCGIPATTLYDIAKGATPHRSTALKICRHTQGFIKPEDFGWLKLCGNKFAKNPFRSKMARS